MRLNRIFNRLRRALGLSYWSLSAYLKRKVKRAVEFVSNFEQAVVREARRRGADGVICGHIHTPEIRTIDGIVYCNDGDWVESCSALVEHLDGRFEVIGRKHASHMPENPMRILLISDAWFPQVNGVVRTLTHLKGELEALGHTLYFITPEGRRSWPMPFYREIRLAFVPPSRLGREIDRFAPDAIHIGTEGPLGLSARAWCVKNAVRWV